MKTKNENKESVIQWLSTPEAHNYPAASNYLSLLFDEQLANQMAEKLKKAKISHFKSKDIFRASNLSLLGVSNMHVKKDIKKIKNKVSLSPILLVRDTHNGKLIIADGYHRLCAVYFFDEDAVIPCKIISSRTSTNS